MRPKRPIWSDDFPVEQISPGNALVHPAALALDDEYDRILGTPPETSIAEETRIALGGPREHPPTLSYNIGPALIAGGTVYYRGGYEAMEQQRTKPVIRGKPVRLARAQLCNNVVTERFFGHWLLDTPALMLLAEQRGLPAATVLTSASSSHRLGYASMMNVPAEELGLAEVEELWVVDDRPTNAGRAARLNEVRRRVRQGRAGGSKRVIIDRGTSGVRRNLANSAELWDILVTGGGFEVIDPLKLSHDALIEKLAAADVVFGVEGSTLCHAVVACPPGALIFAVMPPTRFCTAVKVYTDMIGMKFGFTVAEGTAGDFTIDADRMRRVLGLIESAPRES